MLEAFASPFVFATRTICEWNLLMLQILTVKCCRWPVKTVPFRSVLWKCAVHRVVSGFMSTPWNGNYLLFNSSHLYLVLFHCCSSVLFDVPEKTQSVPFATGATAYENVENGLEMRIWGFANTSGLTQNYAKNAHAFRAPDWSYMYYTADPLDSLARHCPGYQKST